MQQPIRVILWGRNEYSRGLQRNCKTFTEFQDGVFYLNSKGHYVYELQPEHICVTFRFFKRMSRKYIFDKNGVCISHRPKKRIKTRSIFEDDREGLPYAEIQFLKN